MTFTKTAAVAALATVSFVGLGLTTASAGGKHFHPHHHLYFNHGYGPKIVIGGSYYDCRRWLHRYKRTGNPYFLDRYYACKY